MEMGDKVRHNSGSFAFSGTVIGIVRASSGRRVVAVEQDVTNYVQLFGQENLTVTGHSLSVNHEQVDPFFGEPIVIVPPPPPPKPSFPVDIFIPVTPVPRQAARYAGFKGNVRMNYLPAKPPQSLITEKVKAEIEFHFSATPIGDLDNLTKPVLDLLCGSIIHDDNQVMELAVKYMPHSKQSGFRVRLTAYAPQG